MTQVLFRAFFASEERSLRRRLAGVARGREVIIELSGSPVVRLNNATVTSFAGGRTSIVQVHFFFFLRYCYLQSSLFPPPPPLPL